MWLGSGGRLVWISDIDDATYEQYRRENLSYRPYYTEPATSHSIYYSTAIVSNDGVPRMHISALILQDGEFRGVVVAAIRLEVLGEFLKAQLSPEFQSRLPDGLKPTFTTFLSRSLSGGAGAEDITFEGRTGTLAYQTVSVDRKDFAVVYVVAQHNFAGSVVSLICQQRNLSTAMMVAVGAVAVAIVLLIISWDRNLERMVNVRTAELSRAVSSLQQANDQLKAHDKMQQEFINIAVHELRTPIQP